MLYQLSRQSRPLLAAAPVRPMFEPASARLRHCHAQNNRSSIQKAVVLLRSPWTAVWVHVGVPPLSTTSAPCSPHRCVSAMLPVRVVAIVTFMRNRSAGRREVHGNVAAHAGSRGIMNATLLITCSTRLSPSCLEHAAGGRRRSGGSGIAAGILSRLELLACRQGGDGEHHIELLLSSRLHRRGGFERSMSENERQHQAMRLTHGGAAAGGPAARRGITCWTKSAAVLAAHGLSFKHCNRPAWSSLGCRSPWPR